VPPKKAEPRGEVTTETDTTTEYVFLFLRRI
jgi:hypothetical protein